MAVLHGVKKHDLPKPVRIDRPGEQENKPKGSEGVLKMFEGLGFAKRH